MALNFYDVDGVVIDHQLIEQAANQDNISLRTGCFCNPGAGEMALGLSTPGARDLFQQRRSQHDL